MQDNNGSGTDDIDDAGKSDDQSDDYENTKRRNSDIATEETVSS